MSSSSCFKQVNRETSYRKQAKKYEFEELTNYLFWVINVLGIRVLQERRFWELNFTQYCTVECCRTAEVARQIQLVDISKKQLYK